MRIETANRNVDVFTISPRTRDTDHYWHDIMAVARWSEQYGYTGMLIFTGNDTYVDPWLVGHFVLTETRTLKPLIAVNPIFLHPFTAAKLISSFAYLYGRSVALNLVAGTALSYLQALGDELGHDERYDRLLEYARVIDLLLSSSEPVSFDGCYYRLRNAQLLPQTPRELLPRYVIAGHSDAARRLEAAVDAVRVQMLPANLETGGAQAVHMGIVTRSASEDAWRTARECFPYNPQAKRIARLSMMNTDSVWKQELRTAATCGASGVDGYWLAPFISAQADCPYIVGDHRYVADVLLRLVGAGISVFVLEIPACEDDFRHVHAAFSILADRIVTDTGAR